MFTDEDLQLLRGWTIAARDTMHPHGDGCWRVHWPCRVLPRVDDVQALRSTIATERANAARASDEAKALVFALNVRVDQLGFVLARQRKLVAEHHAHVTAMDAELEALSG